jgi:AcrR family transcriptional regulator
MTQPVKNLRLRRTQKLLREALIELIEERGFDALTVGEITGRAMVSRAAFYRNYQDKYDLVEQIFQEAMSELLGAVAELGQEHPPQIWVRFFEHIAQYDRLYHALLGRKGSPWFVMKMRASLTDLVKEHGRGPALLHAVDRPASPFLDDLVPDLVSTMFVEAITWWLEHGRSYPPEEMARRTSLLVSAIFQETSTWK